LVSKGFSNPCPLEIPWHFGINTPTKTPKYRAVFLIKISGLGSYIGGRLQRRLTRGEKTMQGLKGVIVVATIIAAAASLGACRKEIAEPPLKLGAADVVVAVR
jgi:hypothetical protein